VLSALVTDASSTDKVPSRFVLMPISPKVVGVPAAAPDSNVRVVSVRSELSIARAAVSFLSGPFCGSIWVLMVFNTSL
jgi:hypothetical protein